MTQSFSSGFEPWIPISANVLYRTRRREFSDDDVFSADGIEEVDVVGAEDKTEDPSSEPARGRGAGEGESYLRGGVWVPSKKCGRGDGDAEREEGPRSTREYLFLSGN